MLCGAQLIPSPLMHNVPFMIVPFCVSILLSRKDLIHPSFTITLLHYSLFQVTVKRPFFCVFGTRVKFLLNRYMGVDLLNLRTCVCLALINTASSFPNGFIYLHSQYKGVTGVSHPHLYSVFPVFLILPFEWEYNGISLWLNFWVSFLMVIDHFGIIFCEVPIYDLKIGLLYLFFLIIWKIYSEYESFATYMYCKFLLPLCNVSFLFLNSFG